MTKSPDCIICGEPSTEKEFTQIHWLHGLKRWVCTKDHDWLDQNQTDAIAKRKRELKKDKEQA